jgi:hypothetical protein
LREKKIKNQKRPRIPTKKEKKKRRPKMPTSFLLLAHKRGRRCPHTKKKKKKKKAQVAYTQKKRPKIPLFLPP